MEISSLLNSYYTWLKESTELYSDKITKWHVISTPFTGLFNDNIEIYVKISGANITLSDDGETINNLREYGVSFSHSKQRRKILDGILTNYGVKMQGDELTCECNVKNFPQKKHLFLEALTTVNDMFMLSKHNVASVFKEDVEEYLTELGLIFTKDFKFTGESGIDFNFDFLIAHQKKEIILRAINNLDKTTLTTFLYAWEDVAELRSKISKKSIKSVAIVNNESKNINQDYLEALKFKKADYILWTERNSKESIMKLAA